MAPDRTGRLGRRVGCAPARRAGSAGGWMCSSQGTVWQPGGIRQSLGMTMHLETRAIHASAADLNGSHPVSVPIYQTSVFAFDDAAACARALDDPGAGFAYSRYANPTTSALEAVA